MIIYEEDIKGFFDSLPETEREEIMEVVANFHFRDSYRYEDGSVGTIRISPKQLRDCLAFMLKKIAVK